jgi:hypothetical protein
VGFRHESGYTGMRQARLERRSGSMVPAGWAGSGGGRGLRAGSPEAAAARKQAMALAIHLNTRDTGGKAGYRDGAGGSQDPAKVADFAFACQLTLARRADPV